MKQVMTAMADLALIIALRMALSLTFTEQAASVFTNIAVTALLFYYTVQLCHKRKASRAV